MNLFLISKLITFCIIFAKLNKLNAISVLADVDEASNYFSQHCKIIIVSSTALTL